MTTSVAIAIGAVVSAVLLVGSLQWQASQNVVSAGFWFEDVTFDLPGAQRIGGPLTPEEQATISSVARSEVDAAFAGLRVRVTDSRDAFYRVRVVQLLTFRRQALSGQSNVFGPLGGFGSVSFATLASQAVTHAPPGSPRQAIVDAIGRGIGRTAVHELAHQILPRVPLHATTDLQSYEYWSSNRPAQYYGSIRWDVARPFLARRLGHERLSD